MILFVKLKESPTGGFLCISESHTMIVLLEVCFYIWKFITIIQKPEINKLKENCTQMKRKKKRIKKKREKERPKYVFETNNYNHQH